MRYGFIGLGNLGGHLAASLLRGGKRAVIRAVRSARERGAIVVVVAHRPIGVEAANLLLVLSEGRVQAFGPKETVLGQVLQQRAPANPSPIKVVSEGGVTKG